MGADRAAASDQRLQVVGPQKVVGCSRQIDVLHGRGQRLRVGEPFPQSFPKASAELLRLTGEGGGGFCKTFEVAGLGPESEVRHDAQALHEGHGSSGKIVRAGAGYIEGELNDEVGARLKKLRSPGLPGEDGGRAALHVVPAERHYDIVGAALPAGLIDQIFMSLVEGVAFCYYACHFHHCEDWDPFLFFGGPRVSPTRPFKSHYFISVIKVP